MSVVLEEELFDRQAEGLGDQECERHATPAPDIGASASR
jgi:hypothetical protein